MPFPAGGGVICYVYHVPYRSRGDLWRNPVGGCCRRHLRHDRPLPRRVVASERVCVFFSFCVRARNQTSEQVRIYSQMHVIGSLSLGLLAGQKSVDGGRQLVPSVEKLELEEEDEAHQLTTLALDEFTGRIRRTT